MQQKQKRKRKKKKKKNQDKLIIPFNSTYSYPQTKFK